MIKDKEPNYHFDARIKKGDYLADYFKKTKKILALEKPEQIILMQWFQRQEKVIFCGIKQVMALLKFACPNFDKLKIWGLEDGAVIEPLEPVLKIEGHYSDFGWLEGMIDGILARNTSIATNVHYLVKAANGKPVLMMDDRADLYLNQEADGYAAYIGGARNFVSKASLAYIDDPSVLPPTGTMPHALIQAFEGDTLAATQAFYKHFPKVKLVSLVDYHNDVVTDALKVANYFGSKLWAIRLDTATNLIDKTLSTHQKEYPAKTDLKGVNPTLVRMVRQALNREGHFKVKIIVSSGFNAKKIAAFEKEKVPVDIYGVGQAVTTVKISFTGDAVLINGQHQAKFGRRDFPNQNLKRLH